MEAISYVNIFETKGLEYLLVISFLVGFLFFVRLVGSSSKSAAAVGAGAVSPVVNLDEAVEPGFLCLADYECPYKKDLAEANRGEAVLARVKVA